MDLAGYALLMYELDNSGIWPSVKTMWDNLLSARPELADFVLAAATFIDGTVAMTSGGIERSRRSIEMNRVFEQRGIVSADRYGWAEPETVEHQSPIVAALAPGRVGLMNDLYVLFAAEYLKDRVGEGAELGHKAQRLAKQIARYRAMQAEREAEQAAEADGVEHVD
jgi:hypothetical protein